MERPTGVTILAVLAFIGAALCLLAVPILMLGGAALMGMAGAGRSSMATGFLAGLGAAVAFFLVALAALYAISGYGLWTLKGWGRILTLVLVIIGLAFAAIGALSSLMHFRMFLLIRQLIVVGIDVWIITYLLKSHVKQAFGA
jgi:hypothetical protein